MKSKDSPPEKVDDFVDLRHVVRHGPEHVLPLHRMRDAHEQFARDYAEWVFENKISPAICFLDITFFNVQDPKEAWSLIISHDLASVQRYETALEQFIKDGNTVAGHEVFRKGLPSFRDATTGKDVCPGQSKELSRYLHHPEFLLTSERLLRWRQETPAPERVADDLTALTPAVPAYKFVETYKSSPDDNSKLFRGVSEDTITNQWALFVKMLTRPELGLKDAAGRPVSLIVAAPVGVRIGDDGKGFLQFANVFCGLGDGSQDSERRAYAFLRTLMLQLYRANGSAYGEISGQLAAGNSFGHEVKHVATALSDRWMRPAADLFEVEVGEEQKTYGRGKVGRIELASDYSWVAGQLGVIPFKNLITDAGELIRLWCMLDNLADLPIERPSEGFWTLEGFMQECLKLARRTMQPHLFQGESVETLDGLESLCHIRRILEEVWTCQQLVIPPSNDAALTKVSCDNELNVWLARVFVAIFKNCVQHGDPLYPIQAELHEQADDPRRIVVSIVNHRRRKADPLREILMERGYSKTDAQKIVSQLSSADAGARTLELEGGRFSSDSVVRFCLKKLRGVVLEKSEDGANPYTIKFSYERAEGGKA
jgi:hypothetical protein